MRGGFGDGDFPGSGEAHGDLGGWWGSLRRAGYDGPYAVEIEFTGEPWPPLAEVTAAMRASREALAPHGLS